MASDSEDDDMVELRNTLLASMRSETSKAELSSSRGSSLGKRKSEHKEAEIFDTDINDLDALREAALKTVKGSTKKEEWIPGSPLKPPPESPGPMLRASRAGLQFPSNTPRYSYSRASGKTGRSNLIVIQPLGAELETSSMNTKKEERYYDHQRGKYEYQRKSDERERKQTNKWSRQRHGSSPSSDDDDVKDAQSPTGQSHSGSDEESDDDAVDHDPHGSQDEGRGTPVQDEEEPRANPDGIQEEEGSQHSSRSSSPSKPKKEEEDEDFGSLSVKIPGAKPARLSRSLDEEMMELEQNVDGELFEFLEEEPEDLNAIVTEVKLEEDLSKETSKSPSTPPEESRREKRREKSNYRRTDSFKTKRIKAKEILEEQLAIVDNKLHKIKQKPRDCMDSNPRRRHRNGDDGRYRIRNPDRNHGDSRSRRSSRSKERYHHDRHRDRQERAPAWIISSKDRPKSREVGREETKIRSSNIHGTIEEIVHRKDRRTDSWGSPERRRNEDSSNSCAEVNLNSPKLQSLVNSERQCAEKVETPNLRKKLKISATPTASLQDKAILGLARGFSISMHSLMDIKVGKPAEFERPISSLIASPLKQTREQRAGKQPVVKKKEHLDLRELLKQRKKAGSDVQIRKEEPHLGANSVGNKTVLQRPQNSQRGVFPPTVVSKRLVSALSPSFSQAASESSSGQTCPLPKKIIRLKKPPVSKPEPSISFATNSTNETPTIGDRTRLPVHAPIIVQSAIQQTKPNNKTAAMAARLGWAPTGGKKLKRGRGGKKLQKQKCLGKQRLVIGQNVAAEPGAADLIIQSGESRRVIVSNTLQQLSGSKSDGFSFIRKTGKIKLKR